MEDANATEAEIRRNYFGEWRQIKTFLKLDNFCHPANFSDVIRHNYGGNLFFAFGGNRAAYLTPHLTPVDCDVSRNYSSFSLELIYSAVVETCEN